MDLLYSRYASPFEFMNSYIKQGRFGEFVSEILEMDYRRKKQEQEKENDDRLWSVYIRSLSDKSFLQWKEDLKTSIGEAGQKSILYGSKEKPMGRDDVEAAVRRSQEILSGFVPD